MRKSFFFLSFCLFIVLVCKGAQYGDPVSTNSSGSAGIFNIFTMPPGLTNTCRKVIIQVTSGAATVWGGSSNIAGPGVFLTNGQSWVHSSATVFENNNWWANPSNSASIICTKIPEKP